MSNATDHLSSLDSMLTAAKLAFENEKKSFEDRFVQMTMERDLHKTLAEDALAAKAQAERIATKLLTQFSLVEHIFADVKRQAIELGYSAPTEVAEALKPSTTPAPTTIPSASF